MSDEASRIILEQRGQPVDVVDPSLIELFPPDMFDEAAYLLAYPDVATAMQRGEVRSGYIHFVRYGIREGRMPPGLGTEPRNRLIPFAPTTESKATNLYLAQSFETLTVSRSGGVFIIGWIDDSASPVDCIRVVGPEWRLTFDGAALARIRRYDVEEALGQRVGHTYGYFGFLFAGKQIDPYGVFRIEICTKDRRVATHDASANLMDDLELRNTVLSYLAAAPHFGNAQVKGIACVDRGLGGQILSHNGYITKRILASPYVERFGSRRRKHLGSIVVCLYGKVEFLFIQNALFSGGPGIEDYEFIYVCNSPELAESLLREARIAANVYGLDLTVVILPGNAGFGGANNAAVRFAETDRILIVNPDVFPYDRDWAAKHTAVVRNLPVEQTRLFGAPLYYDDGSLMHGGMYFEVDSGPSVDHEKTFHWQLIRVEHYGKGAPPDTARFISPRPVPAVTGAFISCERRWFERLGGFIEDYVFGHYEVAVICLKSIQAGNVPWLQDIKLWHLEGKGSTRLPVHEGGSLVNRWLFSSNWGSYIFDNLLGQEPPHPVFQRQPPAGDGTGSAAASGVSTKPSVKRTRNSVA